MLGIINNPLILNLDIQTKQNCAMVSITFVSQIIMILMDIPLIFI